MCSLAKLDQPMLSDASSKLSLTENFKNRFYKRQRMYPFRPVKTSSSTGVRAIARVLTA